LLAADVTLNGDGEYQFTYLMMYSQQTGGQRDFDWNLKAHLPEGGYLSLSLLGL
jgi:hypothetical protein